MARRKPRGVRADELELWSRVAKTARRMPNSTASTPHSDAKNLETDTVSPEALYKPEPFQIGSRVRPSSGPAESTRSLDLNMDRKTYQKIKRGKTRPDARIDLHGMTSDEAKRELTAFLYSAHSAGKRLVLVITGKGRIGHDAGPIPSRPGVLRRSLPIWVSQPPLAGIVQQLTEAHQRHGGSGAFYLYLRRPR